MKQLISIKPTSYKIDKKGNKIPVYRGGILDNNKYAKRGKKEQEMKDNLNNKDYKP